MKTRILKNLHYCTYYSLHLLLYTVTFFYLCLMTAKFFLSPLLYVHCNPSAAQTINPFPSFSHIEHNYYLHWRKWHLLLLLLTWNQIHHCLKHMSKIIQYYIQYDFLARAVVPYHSHCTPDFCLMNLNFFLGRFSSPNWGIGRTVNPILIPRWGSVWSARVVL